jgi:hypothetical protein
MRADVARVGRLGEITYLVDQHVAQAELEIYDVLIASADRPAWARGRLQSYREAIQPYVGKHR